MTKKEKCGIMGLEAEWVKDYDPKAGQWYLKQGWLDRGGDDSDLFIGETSDIIEECGG